MFPTLFLLLGCPAETPDPVVEDCVTLCDRVVLCTESVVAPAIAADDTQDPDDFTCSFDDEAGARALCEEGCVEAGDSPTHAACITCLADNMSCSSTGSMRDCDVDCEPTLFVTGKDGEGALEYDYASWFFVGVRELEGITCVQ